MKNSNCLNKLKPTEKIFWESYIDSLPQNERPKEPHVEASYAGSKRITDKLIELYLEGKKTAGSSIKEDFISAGDPLPKVGNFWIILNSNEEPQCLVQTVKVVENKFYDVPLEIAIAEGEGDLSLEYWRNAHKKFYEPHLEDWGLSRIDDATVITEFFAVVYCSSRLSNI
ncbi:MAG: ASCH domain-containing protein [Bdellovibrionales bacterium]|nr:ASCH domain-containing protein [Bdellovibrionales bacterium]